MDPTDYRVVTVVLPYDDDSSMTNLRIAFIDDLWMALPGHTESEEMSEPDFQSLLNKYDKSDMAGFTRKFVDDLEAALSAEIDIDSDMIGAASSA